MRVCVCVYAHTGETQHQSLSPSPQAPRTVRHVTLAARISRDTPHYTTNFLVSVQAMCQVFVGQDLVPPFITTGSPLFEYVDLPLSLAHPFSNITEQSAARASVARSAVCPPSPVLTTKVGDPTFHTLFTHTNQLIS